MSLGSSLQRLRVSRPVGLLRYHLYRDILLAFPKRHACNVCEWSGRRFLTFYHPFVLCPRCGSQIRHRLIAAAFSDLDDIRLGVPLTGARVLHLSPEYCLSLLFRPQAAQYVRGDYSTDDCDIHVDITNMSGIATDSFDIVVACDVLEHVMEDQAAMREMHRVLRPGGTAVLTVPQADGLQTTEEDPSVVTPEDRARRFGQFDHVRNYGADFDARLKANGFTVRIVEARSFSRARIERHVLSPPIAMETYPAFNHRRIYFAQARKA